MLEKKIIVLDDGFTTYEIERKCFFNENSLKDLFEFRLTCHTHGSKYKIVEDVLNFKNYEELAIHFNNKVIELAKKGFK